MAQSVMRRFGPAAGAAVALLCAAALGGCGMSSLTSGLGTSIFSGGSGGSAEPTAVSEEQLLAAAKSGDGSATAVTGPRDEARAPRLGIPAGERRRTFTAGLGGGDEILLADAGRLGTR
jgi:hypothetical protein